MRTVAIVLFIIFVISTAGCATNKDPDPVAPALLRDDIFPSYTLFPVETNREIFALGEDAIKFVNQTQAINHTPKQNISQLARQIFDHAELGLLYRSNANSVAAETFANRAANCLSLSILTYSMARAAGFTPQFYQVDIPEYWTRREGYNLLNGHINLRIAPTQNSQQITLRDVFVDVDFDPQAIRSHFKRVAIDKERVVAMFYNNKGADALLADRYTRAYAYFRAAAKTDPTLGQAWVNLGVVYRKQGEYAAAQQSYQKAIAMDEENLTAWENLAVLYRLSDRQDRADDIQARLRAKRQANPFYHFILGEEALDNGRTKQALSHYRQALKLDRRHHEVLFGLGKAYYALGDISRAEAYLTRAAAMADSAQDKHRYNSKLSALQTAN